MCARFGLAFNQLPLACLTQSFVCLMLIQTSDCCYSLCTLAVTPDLFVSMSPSSPELKVSHRSDVQETNLDEPAPINPSPKQKESPALRASGW